MKITMLLGSPNRQGSSNLLAASFARGAKEAGHTVEVIDAAHADLRPCTGCVRCGYEGYMSVDHAFAGYPSMGGTLGAFAYPTGHMKGLWEAAMRECGQNPYSGGPSA